ncbi:hypothetical protein CEP54_011945 [Fusarium duplospermum]|uniref:Uncharacterized protein n=1 Tax=Fusarium duplospermum TaxID=1325734 RepID=A0A428PBM3_9HYPO|nr:hypothetical protein CEP54_011945 [Fusarium duplospermum]
MSLLNAPSSQDVALAQLPARQADQTAAVNDLEKTIASFQAILTDDDRKNLQQLKAEPHDAQSIIMFTARLDRSDPNRKGKSVASRLASFLQTIEQFTPIVDTYIQSNPDIAALVWGSVKLTFLLLANFTSYFQSFVDLLSGFGSLCSRFAEYQVIYKDFPRLKISICGFHSSVVNCCEKIVLATRRPMKSQAWMAITQSFPGEMRGYVDEIKSKAEIVRDDIQLAKAQSDNEEHQLQAKARQKAEESHRSLSSLLRKVKSETRLIGDHAIRETAEQRRHRLLKDLSSHNYTSAFNNARNKRHRGTAEWAFNTAQFQNWLTGEGPAVLHVTGKIGSGKTILATHFQHIIASYPNANLTSQPNQFISFFFSRFDDPTTLTSDTIIRSLLQQLLSVAPMETMDPFLASEIADFLQKAHSNFFSLDTLGKLYVAASKFTQDWFILVDGVDECESKQQQLLCSFLSRFLNNCSRQHRVRVMLSGRETTKQEIDLSFGAVERLMAGTSNTSADIVAFAEDVIDTKLARGELVVRDPDVVGDILKTIASKEEGMFLWAFLVIEDICSGTNDKEIREALQDIPTDLPTTFDRALGRIAKRRKQKIARQIFGWTTAARQPLTLTQLQEALSVKVGQRNLHPDDLVSAMDRITGWCENLVCVEETDNTVHFSHHSIREYLLQYKSGDLEDFHVNLEESDHHAGEVCITYLYLENLNRTLIEGEKAEPHPGLTVAMEGLSEQMVRTAVGGSMGALAGRWTSRVVKSSARSARPATGDAAIRSTLGNLRHARPDSREIECAFRKYAEDNWFLHRTRLVHTSNQAENSMWNLVCRLLRSPHQRENLPWNNMLETITFCIAAGFGPWPASEKVVEASQSCQCSNNRFHDFCKLIPTGYSGEQRRRLSEIAIVALCALTKANFGELPSVVNDYSIVFTARTSNNMSVVDIAAEQNDLDGLHFLESLFQQYWNEPGAFESTKRQREIKELAFNGLCTALRSGSSNNAKYLFEQCVNLFSPESANQFKTDDIMHLHDGLREAVKFEWPFGTTKSILSWFFRSVAVKRDTEATMKINQLIQEAVESDNWKLAAAVVDAVSGLKFDKAESDDPFFNMTLEAMSCQKCRERQSWPEHNDTQLLFAGQHYKLCSTHKRQAQATLDPRFYLTPDKKSLKLRSSELEQDEQRSDAEIEEDSVVCKPLEE